MTQRQLGALVIAGGILAVLFALFADTIGIGAREGTFGWKQGVLLGLGILAMAVGGLIAGKLILVREPEQLIAPEEVPEERGAARAERPGAARAGQSEGSSPAEGHGQGPPTTPEP